MGGGGGGGGTNLVGDRISSYTAILTLWVWFNETLKFVFARVERDIVHK